MAPADVPMTMSQLPMSTPASARPWRTPVSQAIPVTPPPPRTSALVTAAAPSGGSSPTWLPLDALHDGRDALPHADAHRRDAVAPAGSAQLVDEHRHQASAARPERMARGDRPAVDVDLVRIEPELVDGHDRLAGEGLVQLDEVEVR